MAATVSGMSGGPIFNKTGKVIGVHGVADIEDLKKLSFTKASEKKLATKEL